MRSLVPADPTTYDAQVILWARQSSLASGLEDRLISVTKTWIAEAWPFKNVGFPGREIPWSEWLAKK